VNVLSWILPSLLPHRPQCLRLYSERDVGNDYRVSVIVSNITVNIGIVK
jgi:hypothetical protein